MTPDQYIMRAVKKTGELYVISGSTLHETCRALEERRQVELKAEASPVGTIYRVTEPQKGTSK